MGSWKAFVGAVMGALALMVCDVATAHAAVKFCDIYWERCKFGRSGRLYYFPIGRAANPASKFYREEFGNSPPPDAAPNRGGVQTRRVRPARPSTGLPSDESAGLTSAPRQLAIKNGESIEIGSVFWVLHCRSIMAGLPTIEILQGLPGVTLGIKEEPVVPRRLGCTAEVPGGKLVLTAKNVTEQSEGKLIYRIKYKTKDGPRQTGHNYIVSLFP